MPRAQGQWPFGSTEEFLPYMSMAAILSCDLDHIVILYSLI